VAQQIRDVVESLLWSKRGFQKEAPSVSKLFALFIPFDLLIQEYCVACRDGCPQEAPLAQEIELGLVFIW